MVSARATAALSALLLACGEAVTLAPVIDTPAAGSEADPLPGLDEVELSLARAGDDDALIAASFARGQTLSLPGVPYGDDLVVHLVGRTGETEIAYGRTCAFDLEQGATPPEPHLYFSRMVKWSAGATPPRPARVGGHAFVAADGSGVWLGGVDGATGEPLSGVDQFDARAGAFTDLAQLEPRRRSVLGVLGDGRAVVAGGVDATDLPVGLAELVDPLAFAALRVERVDAPDLALVDAAAATLDDGSVVIMGGLGDSGGGTLVPVGGVWIVEAAVGGGLATPRAALNTLAIARSGHTLTRLSDDLGAPVLVVGGLDSAGAPIAQAELYKPLREDFAPAAPMLQVARHGHAAARMPDGSVLVIGGLDAAGQPVDTAELFALDSGFAPAGVLPGTDLVDFTATPLPDGRLLIAGGRHGTGAAPVATVLIARLDPLDGSVDVVATDELATPRAGHRAVLLCDGTVLVVGGTDGPAPAERYNPPRLGRR